MAKASAPPTPNYGNILSQTMTAQGNLAPSQYVLESNYQPAYGAVTASTLEQLLNGTEGGPQAYTYQGSALRNGWYDNSGQLVSSRGAGYKGAPTGATFRRKNDALTMQGSINIPKSSGLLALLNSANNSQRTSDINAIQNLGPLAKMALTAANPEAASLVSKLTSQANEGLDAGSMMTGDEMRNLNASLRSSMGARGISYGPNASYQEALAGSQFGEQLKQQRQSDALQALAANQAYFGDPFEQILGRQSGANSSALAALGQSGAQIFNPNAANQLYAGAQQNQAQVSAANAAGVNSLLGAGIGGLATIGSKFI